MRRAPRAAAGAALSASMLLLASCGMLGALGDDDAGQQTAIVGVLVPQSGWLEADAAGVIAAVELAVEETAGDINGWTVEVVPTDEDEDDIGQTTAGVVDLLDQGAIAVIGGLAETPLRSIQPLLEKQSVLFVSPADVDPVNTKGAAPLSPLRPYTTYFRAAVGGEAPAALLARYSVIGLGDDAVAVIDAGDPGGTRAFSAGVDAAGGTVVFSSAMASEADLAAAMQGIVANKAEAVFVTGSAEFAGRLATRIRKAGLDVSLLIGSSAGGKQFVESAGAAADGALRAVPAELEPTAGLKSRDLAGKLDAAGKPPQGKFGAAAYDAATAVATVLTRCLPPASSAASAGKGCVGEMSQIDFAGVTGRFSFDKFGDRSGGVAGVEALDAGQWRPV